VTAARRSGLLVIGINFCGRSLVRRPRIPGPYRQPPKAKSTERIDGIVALIMAIGRAMIVQEEPQPQYRFRQTRGAPRPPSTSSHDACGACGRLDSLSAIRRKW
jgi:hypothetical protein